MCRNYKSGNKCIHGKNCLYRHADGEEKPSKRSKSESTQRAVAILKEKKSPRLCMSKFRCKKVYSSECWANEIERFDGPGTKFKFGKEKGHLEAFSKNTNLMSEILARPVLRKEYLRNSHDKKSTSAKQHRIWRENFLGSRSRTKLRFILM